MTEEIIKELKEIALNLMIRSEPLKKYSTLYYYDVDWAINDVNDEVEKIAECVEEWKQVWEKMTDNLNKED